MSKKTIQHRIQTQNDSRQLLWAPKKMSQKFDQEGNLSLCKCLK